AASIVAMAGDRVEMAEGALMMVHDPWSMSVGTAQDHNDEAAVLNLVRDSLAGIYASRLTSGSEEQAREMMARETWLTASEAVALGLADDVREALPIAAYGDLSRFAAARTVKGDRTVEQAFTEWCLAYPALALTPHQPDPDMTTIHPKILAALDLPDEAEVDTIVSTIKAAKAVATQLAELTARKDMAEAMGTVRAWKDAAARHDEAVAALTALRVDAIQSEAETLIKDATPKKLTPALATYWRQEIEAAVQNNAGERALAQLKGYLAAATRILPEPSIQPSNNTTDVLGGYGGKPYAELQPAERAQLKRGQPDIYAALKAAARGES
ncbi:MAG: ATP-dependent Clp protease proteolytic subunit, partial [Myxococcota bacterium]